MKTEKTQIFISYRRDGGAALAGRISDRLSSKYQVFYDVETMHSGQFNTQITNALEECSDMVLVLPPNALDRCINEDDWVRKEISLALENNKNIIPIMMDGFEFPKVLPSDIESICNFESVKDDIEYFDSVMDKIERFLTCSESKFEPEPFSVGSIVGKNYQITCELGKGGSSVIYLAQDINMEMMVAIKRARKNEFADFNSAKERLLQEFHIQKMCKHCGIANVRDFFMHNDEFAIVMDYIPGAGLNDIILKNGYISEKDALEWGVQICSTLSYIHNLDTPFYHCDIKPSNIIINNKNEAILIDFGVSKQDISISLDDTTVLGTKGYAAPEQGANCVDGRTDIYGLGQTLYYALTGKTVMEAPYENLPIRQWRPELSKDIEQVIAKCVLKNPENRYQTAKELKTALAHILAKQQTNSQGKWYMRIFKL